MLTPRQKEVLQKMIFSGKSNAEIAADLNLTQQTVRNYIQRIYVCLGINNLRQLFPMVIAANQELRQDAEIAELKRMASAGNVTMDPVGDAV